MRTVHIEKRAFDAEQAATDLRAALRRNRTLTTTAADASVLSGVPLHSCEAGLLALAARYPATLGVGADGTLSFTFRTLADPDTRGRRLFRALQKRWRAIAPPVARWLTWNIVLILVIGFFSNIAMLGDGKFSNGQPSDIIYGTGLALGLVASLVLVFSIVPLFIPVLIVAMAIKDFGELSFLKAFVRTILFGAIGAALGYAYYRMADGAIRFVSRGKEPLPAARALFLGPPRKRSDSLADERRLTAAIRARKGVICTADLMALFGWTPADADRELVRILVAYGGDVHVADNGGIFLVFEDLASPTERAPKGDPPAAIAPRPAPPFMTGSRRFLYGLLVALAVSAIALAAGNPERVLPGMAAFKAAWREHGDALDLLFRPGVGLWPHIIIGVWLGVRVLLWRLAVRRHTATERRHALIRAILAHPDGLDVAAHDVDSRTLAAFGAEAAPDGADAGGRMRVTFPAIVAGQRAAAAFSR